LYFVKLNRIIYVQRKSEDKFFAPVEVISSEKFLDKKVYRVVSKEKVFEYGIYKMNPNAWYVLGKDKEARKIFGMYLNRHHPSLKDLFIRATTEDPPLFFYQEHEIKRILLEKFHNNLDYGIFDVKEGKIVVRSMPNKEIIHKLKNIIGEMNETPELRIFSSKIKSMMEETQKLKRKLNILSDQKNNLLSTSLTDPEHLQKIEELKMIEKKLLYSPLWVE